MPIDPIRQGMTVEYLGVEWTVVQRVYMDASFSVFKLGRINDLDQYETASPPYYSKLVMLSEKKSIADA